VFCQIADDEFERVAMGEYSSEDDARCVRYATRQPILAADETVIGYKLLFRSDVVSHFAWKECEGASRAAIEISSLLGLKVLCDNRLAFVQCTRDVLLEKYLTFLPANKVVAQIGCRVLPDGAVEETCRALKTAGYKFAFDEFKARDPRESIIDLADFLAVDIKQTSWEDILRVTNAYGNQSQGLLAENVETREEFEYAQKAGFHYFKGYFFRKPEMIRTRAVPANRVAYLRLLQAISRPEMQWDELENLIKKDAALYFRLLRYLNSSIFGIRGEVRSVNQALTILGENELRRWCRLAGAFELSGDRPSDLILAALVRARFGELVENRVEHGAADLFLVGLLSLMDAILQIPMSLVIDGLSLDTDSTAMLLDNAGPLLPLYRLIWALEYGAWGAVVRACGQLGLPEESVAKAFSNAMGWAQSMTSAL
jgi:EAL and modified HD-GYP domain-containing signal transduction protein